ncbi:hypothetical protein F5Y17DRAFT_461354 [Xylariaceae sp. FL0594]|nr:hypothetical protein F5Y17DRAFT_461354 [Xylariaceae sp. FL0594]
MSSSIDPRIRYGLSCPAGGSFFVCQNSTTKFLGCCDINPCIGQWDGVCPDEQLFPASFSASSGAVLLDAQDCMPPWHLSGGGGYWYTCPKTLPPFLGCCKRNPCVEGCKPGFLLPAVLSDDPRNASQFYLPKDTGSGTAAGPGTSSSSAASSTATSSNGNPTATSSIMSQTTATTSSASPTATSSNAGQAQGTSHTVLIVGPAVAGVVVLLAIVALYLWLKKRGEERHTNDKEGGEEAGKAPSASPGGVNSGATPPPGAASELPDTKWQGPQEIMSTPLASNTTQKPHISELE